MAEDDDAKEPEFDLVFQPAYGRAVPVAPKVMRVTVNNPSPFTFHGTNTYLLGHSSLALIDPGPEDEAHFEALMAAIDGREVTHIFVSHTHRDHSPLAARLKRATGAITVAEGPHRSARPLFFGEANPLAESADADFVPDVAIGDGEKLEGDGWTIEAIHTPGHTANHTVFALEGSGILFSADHVMSWATTIVAPPDGSMADYMASLDKLLSRDDRLMLPGHGGPVREPQSFLRGLRTHRRMRERAVLERIKAGDRLIPDMVRAIYTRTDPRLHGAAALSVLAHLEDLVEKGRVTTEGPPSLAGAYFPA
ncbi:glyoxylase-like metal-dependent hydrolase (beta-lactamase superfamily II) [Pseudorhizobium tarimense]|uniref:Glyoxylase-like metal-dependent hydrolase (Beta-lactamase superfamily II) n=1 Tax=Pseudorhizobium tarimense TaxID=1079109 RepID=A0ABV2H0W7_9HYPH|nr:MBL fold metallo-hydrolase [Pseudorhizobium tarimense]MCJ8517498.1 MBL fold metallo-hydrolase [Pseudorhizobium tarimense]